MKKIYTALTLFSCFSAFAAVDMDEFCSDAHKEATYSEEAVNNDGKYKIRIRRAGEKIPRTRLKTYRGCRYDVEWMSEVRDLACSGDEKREDIDLSTVNIPKNFIFIFDGAGDFNANRAVHSNLKPVNLDGSEGRDVFMGNFNGGRRFATRLEPYLSNSEVHYHASSGLHKREGYLSAYQCGKQIKKYLDVVSDNTDVKNKSKWLTLGFSNGGVLATEFQYDMGQNDISIDLSISVDPVEQALMYFPSKIWSTVGDKKHKQTKRMVNIYQTDDFDSMPGFELRGKPVKGADVNIEVSHRNDSAMSKDGDMNHLVILRSNVFKSVFDCELKKFFLNPIKNCNYEEFQLNN